MKIGIDARELRTSSGRYVERLLHYLQQIDKANDYSVLLKPEDMDGWQGSNPKFQPIPCPYKEFTFGEQLGLRQQIESLDVDLFHFPFPQQPVQYRGKTVTTFHDLTTLRFNNPAKNWVVFKFKQQVYARVIKRVAQKSAELIVPSEFVKQDIASFTGVDEAKIHVTYEAADVIASPAEPLRALEDKQFIMYVGRPTPHKNLGRLIEAFVKLKAEHPELILVLAGKKDVNYMRIESAVHQRTIKNIIFTDHVSEGRLRWLYENCAAYVYPSLSEGFGLPGLEAMVHGAPVVASNATCLPEIYGQAAHYFDPLNIDEMATAINDVLTDSKLRQALIADGKIQAAKYSWQRLAQQTLEIYEKAAAS